ncbi:uncharacterized protein LOC113338535 [Papaver somniferum]|uniref:uncharacterized protein LOC113338535 n=1 Tax=Papaver somniferum TaxID=3469 RepID=UPI000E7055DE|nr:uncharacterized protein LOC113338535 [Papaver somniferum]
MKNILRDWNWSMFGNVNEKIKEAEEEVQKAMELSDNNPADTEMLNRLVMAENTYSSREVLLKTMLQQKTRAKWVKEVSANTSFFHTNLKIRQSRNFITKMKDKTEEDDSLVEVIPEVITEQDQQMLDAIPNAEEIKEVIFSMDPESSPVPYGVKSPNHFRPIGLSNVNFKKITKIINIRMSSLMTKLISPQQVAYIKGRSIQEKIILASELVNEMRKKRRGGNVALKLDISQAYDSVNWNFLFQVLCKYGFSKSWCQWLQTLFESAKISVMINGGPQGFFSIVNSVNSVCYYGRCFE